jgi:hypothetical protein
MRDRRLLLALFGAVMLIACGPGIEDRLDRDELGASRLEALKASVELAENAREEVAVRCLDDEGAPVVGVSVAFAIAHDRDSVSRAQLARQAATTGQDGIATVELTVAAQGTFTVVAKVGDGRHSVSIRVRVVAGGARAKGTNVLEPFDPSIELLEHQERTIRVRYTDEDGLPIAAAPIRFSLREPDVRFPVAQPEGDSSAAEGLARCQRECTNGCCSRRGVCLEEPALIGCPVEYCDEENQYNRRCQDPLQRCKAECKDGCCTRDGKCIRALGTDTCSIAGANCDDCNPPRTACPEEGERHEHCPPQDESAGPSTLNGAWLSSREGLTDTDGVAVVTLHARGSTSFIIEADADGAIAPTRMNVSVAKDSGGKIDVSVYQAAAVAVTAAEVLLVDDLECANFDALEPPPASNAGVNTRQTVPIRPGQASTVSYRGVKPGKSYTVVAIGRAVNQVVARGCREGLFMTEEMVDEKRSKTVSIHLEDRLVMPMGSELSVITKFNNSIGLTGIAGLMKSLGGYSNGPADYVMNQIAIQSSKDADLKALMTRYRDQLARILAGEDGPQQASRLLAAARALASVEDVRLHSRISIRDEGDQGFLTNKREIEHRMDKFSAMLENSARQLVRRDFMLSSLADPILSARRRVFGGTRLKLQDTALMRVDDAARVSISPHTMSLPLADAIMGQILFDHFGDYTLSRIVGQMIDCDRAGAAANDFADQAGLDSRELEDNLRLILLAAGGEPTTPVTISDVISTICQAEVEKIVHEAQRRTEEELKAFRSDQFVVLEGSADMLMLSDGVTIGSLKNGSWTGLGSFEAIGP